jgi:lysozyme family protein
MPAIRWLQTCLNVMNRRATSWPDVQQNGAMDAATLAAVAACAGRGEIGTLLVALNALQGAHYIRLAESDPTQERFMHGWLARARQQVVA